MIKACSPFLFIAFILLSCWESNVAPVASDPSEQPGPEDVVTDVYGRIYPTLDPYKIYCGPAWGAKMCHFLYKHNGTVWTDPADANSDLPDVKFENFTSPFFISFFRRDSVASYCEGWQLGETNLGGIKWDIEIRKNEDDIFWFDYKYYGTSSDIQYTTTYKYAVIDELLHFSSTDGQSMIYHPSERTYSTDSPATGEIVEATGCLFY